MHTIYKYPIQITDRQIIELPNHSKIVHVGLDPEGNPCLWAEVDTDEYGFLELILFVVGTGRPTPPATTHLGSFVQGSFVWHVYRR